LSAGIPRRWGAAVAAVLFVLVSFGAGAWVERGFPGALPLPASPGSQFDQAKVQQAARVIETNSYDAGVGGSQLSQGSVQGMVDSLDDPFSQYLTPDQFRTLQDSFAGRHDGVIGISLTFQQGYPVIAGVLPNSPALRAGLQTDDVILRIDGKDAHGLTPGQTSALIRGADGSSVLLLVGRATDQFDVAVTRERFQSPTVESLRLPGDILYLRVYQFGDSTQREFDRQLAASLAGARGAVLDLRGNGGGRVSAAVAMVSRFVAAGVVFEERGRDGRTDRVSVDGNDPAPTLPLAVLVDGSSASASEIVAGSLRAHGRATLVGARTFGKGSVQIAYELRDGSAINLTVQHWYLPDGQSINGSGLVPDVAVDLPQPTAMFDVVQPSRGYGDDTQLTRALAVLQG
jgi:carboxyl-terminal processing protease